MSTWKLLTLVKKDRIFTKLPLKWVDGIVWAISAGWVVLAGVVPVRRVQRERSGLPLLLFLMSVGVAVLGLPMIVMRALPRQATTLRSDMESVI